MRRMMLRACCVVGMAAGIAQARAQQTVLHTNPLNLDAQVRQGFTEFYNLDMDGAVATFRKVEAAHPQDPMAVDYVLFALIFRELYRQDLLDTTYYARDNFLTNKREVHVDPALRQEIEDRTNRVLQMTGARIQANAKDKDAYFARGYARGFHAAFITLVDHSYGAAARQGLDARNDSEAVLKIDPEYADAKMAIGIQQFAAGSLPGWVRMIVGMFGAGGNKQRGLQLLREAGAKGTITNVESRTTLSLFLRHDGKYVEALEVQHGLAEQYPHNFIFRLEVANLLKDQGHGLEAIAEYKRVLADAAKPGYFADARLQLAYFGLGDTQQGYNQLVDAAVSFQRATDQPNASDWLRKRALVHLGEVEDQLGDRAKAVAAYQKVLTLHGDRTQDALAKQYLKTPYAGR